MAEPDISKTGSRNAKTPGAIFGVEVIQMHVSVYTAFYKETKINCVKSWAI
jgi:hypothetical protein